MKNNGWRLEKIIRQRAEQAQISLFSPHDLRRMFCADLYQVR